MHAGIVDPPNLDQARMPKSKRDLNHDCAANDNTPSARLNDDPILLATCPFRAIQIGTKGIIDKDKKQTGNHAGLRVLWMIHSDDGQGLGPGACCRNPQDIGIDVAILLV